MVNKKTSKEKPKNLKITKKPCFETWNKTTINKAFDFAEGYKDFLNKVKTEKEAVIEGEKMAKAKGFKDLRKAKSIKAGDKIYFIQRNKSIIFAKIGKKKIHEGFNLIMSHIDSPRLDLKVTPLYEEENIAFLKTHYYGGIKKYQWPTVPLALHGTIYLENGNDVEVKIGEDEKDPVFMITDLLPHLDRAGGPGTEIKPREVQGEDLNLIFGSMPIEDDKNTKEAKEKVKEAILSYMYEKYGVKEADLSSADLSAVPRERARDLGIDRSLISAYGHDDKICAHSSLEALFNSNSLEKTQICAWVDREEIGSEGTTGAQSIFFENFISELTEKNEGRTLGIGGVYKAFSRSRALSADVTAGLDPDYKDVHDPRNAHRLGYGLAFEKYTGSGGKTSSSEASGEFLRDLRVALNKDKVVYQMGAGLGKVDQGGGGTIAKFMANRDIEIVDAGTPVFNMHAPLEIASKADLYSAYLGYKAFYTNIKNYSER